MCCISPLQLQVALFSLWHLIFLIFLFLIDFSVEKRDIKSSLKNLIASSTHLCLTLSSLSIIEFSKNFKNLQYYPERSLQLIAASIGTRRLYTCAYQHLHYYYCSSTSELVAIISDLHRCVGAFSSSESECVTSSSSNRVLLFSAVTSAGNSTISFSSSFTTFLLNRKRLLQQLLSLLHSGDRKTD